MKPANRPKLIFKPVARLMPDIAKCLNIINITIIALSLLLSTLAMSINNRHSDSESALNTEHATWLVSVDYKTLGDSRLWFVKPALGGGIIVTDNIGQVHNIISARHYWIFTRGQSVLFALIISACTVMILLMISGNYLRLVAASALVILMVVKLGVSSLFSLEPSAPLPLSWQIMLLVWLAITYWLANQSLLKHSSTSDTLIAYASQSGSAMSLAKRLKKSLVHSTDVRCFSSLTPSCLTQYNEVLFIASTYGDGQPPEKAQGFIRKLSAFDPYAQHVPFSILALGDSHYPHFCAFGHQLNQLLTGKGATAMFDTVEVDKLDSVTIGNWWQKISSLRQWQSQDIEQVFLPLTVTNNSCLNSSQVHRQAHLLQFSSPQLSYQAGDLLEIVPKITPLVCENIIAQLGFDKAQAVSIDKQTMPLNQAMATREWQGETADTAQQLIDQLKPLSPRVYSIVSAPHQQHLDIFVRSHQRTDGNSGIASSYLCALDKQHVIQGNIRHHPNFHLPSDDVPLILIGAGTGIAPLMSFLRQRSKPNSVHKSGLKSEQETVHKISTKHWLFFGEQYQDSDFYFKDEIGELTAQGVITQLSLAWSRDANASYIGEHIEQQQVPLLQWINELGASIYVCGNQQGFGDSVCAILSDIIGSEPYSEMKQNGRLRTDLY